MDLNNLTFFIYEIIRDVRIAAKNLNLTGKDIENIFYLNAKRLINDIIKNAR